VILCIKFCTTDAPVVEAAVVVEIDADNSPDVSLEVASVFDVVDELELALAHQIIPPMMARMIMPAMT
jgi:hypothetical protein